VGNLFFILGIFFSPYAGLGKENPAAFAASFDKEPREQQQARDSFPFKIGAVIPYFNYFETGEYLFFKWVKGTLVAMNGEQINNDAYFLNYNKVSHNVFLTTDFKEILEIDRRELRSFVFKDGAREYVFEHVPVIDDKNFFQVIVKSRKYSLYKLTYTKFKRNEGFNGFGEFVDSYRYFVIFPDSRIYKQVGLSRKSLMKNLVADPAKMEAYFSLHPNSVVTEDLLTDLVNYLNQ
jgi:hypothetical protein